MVIHYREDPSLFSPSLIKLNYRVGISMKLGNTLKSPVPCVRGLLLGKRVILSETLIFKVSVGREALGSHLSWWKVHKTTVGSIFVQQLPSTDGEMKHL